MTFTVRRSHLLYVVMVDETSGCFDLAPSLKSYGFMSTLDSSDSFVRRLIGERYAY